MEKNKIDALELMKSQSNKDIEINDLRWRIDMLIMENFKLRHALYIYNEITNIEDCGEYANVRTNHIIETISKEEYELLKEFGNYFDTRNNNWFLTKEELEK